MYIMPYIERQNAAYGTQGWLELNRILTNIMKKSIKGANGSSEEEKMG